jgi:hypothetical protein
VHWPTRADDRSGSDAVIRRCPRNVRFAPGSGRRADIDGRQVRARNGLVQCNKGAPARSAEKSCASDTLQQGVEIQGGVAPEIQCMRLQKDLSRPSPLIV